MPPEPAPRSVGEIARELGLSDDEWIPYGRTKAKIPLAALRARRARPDGKLVVSSITPTPAGEGKTTMTVGLGQALWRVGSRAVIALRQPSIGPTLGQKGGGTGGGRAQDFPGKTGSSSRRPRRSWRSSASPGTSTTSRRGWRGCSWPSHSPASRSWPASSASPAPWPRCSGTRSSPTWSRPSRGLPPSSKLGDVCVTEAGFGFDLGAEKFFDIKCRYAGLNPDAVVLVVTVRALKYHGTGDDAAALEQGMANLDKHVEDIRLFRVPLLVAINRFPSDTERELGAVSDHAARLGVKAVVADVFARGGEGGVELARQLLDLFARERSQFTPLYDWGLPVREKIALIAGKMYGADGVSYPKPVERRIDRIQDLGYGGLPICMAKTPRSLSDDPELRGRPRDFWVTVNDMRISAGAGFLVPITGDILTMPGLPKHPNAERIDVTGDGAITGLE